jgi:hypothetical protein
VSDLLGALLVMGLAAFFARSALVGLEAAAWTRRLVLVIACAVAVVLIVGAIDVPTPPMGVAHMNGSIDY